LAKKMVCAPVPRLATGALTWMPDSGVAFRNRKKSRSEASMLSVGQPRDELASRPSRPMTVMTAA